MKHVYAPRSACSRMRSAPLNRMSSVSHQKQYVPVARSYAACRALAKSSTCGQSSCPVAFRYSPVIAPNFSRAMSSVSSGSAQPIARTTTISSAIGAKLERHRSMYSSTLPTMRQREISGVRAPAPPGSGPSLRGSEVDTGGGESAGWAFISPLFTCKRAPRQDTKAPNPLLSSALLYELSNLKASHHA